MKIRLTVHNVVVVCCVVAKLDVVCSNAHMRFPKWCCYERK